MRILLITAILACAGCGARKSAKTLAIAANDWNTQVQRIDAAQRRIDAFRARAAHEDETAAWTLESATDLAVDGFAYRGQQDHLDAYKNLVRIAEDVPKTPSTPIEPPPRAQVGRHLAALAKTLAVLSEDEDAWKTVRFLIDYGKTVKKDLDEIEKRAEAQRAPAKGQRE